MMTIGMCARRVIMVALLLVTAVAQMAGAAAVTNVDSTKPDGTYGVGTVIDVTVLFDAAVTVDTSGGTPRLLLETGTIDTYAPFFSGNGTATLTFRYTVVAGNTSVDLSYTATNALEANGGTIRVGGVDANLTLATPFATGSLGANRNLTIDTIQPIVQTVTSSSANGAYPLGSVIPIQVVFSKAVTVTGTPTLTLATGVATPVAYSSGSGTTTLVFNYTVASGQSSADLTYTSTSALALTGGTIRDVGLNDAVLTLPGSSSGFSLGELKNIAVDGILPTVTLVQGTSGTYGLGATVNLQVVFSEAVTVVGTPTLSVATPGPSLVNYSSPASTTTLNFPYTVAAGQNSIDLDYSSTGALTLNGGTIRDAAGNNAVLTLPVVGSGASLAGTSGIVIDTIAPTVAFVRCGTANGTYDVGAVLQIEVVFDKSMAVTGSPRLALANGGTTQPAFGTIINSTTLTFPYTVEPGDFSSDLNYSSTSALSLNGGIITDTLGNPADLLLPPVASGLSLAGTSALVINTTGYKMITSTTADGVYGQNSSPILITVMFTESVTVTGAPTLTLNSGGSATYFGGSPGNVLTFRYLIGPGDVTNDLNVSSIALNGGGINGTGPANLAVPADHAVGSLSANKNIGIETTAPTVVSVTSSVADGFYRAGVTIPISVVFSEAVTLSSPSPGPTLALQTGSGTPTVVSYAGGSGTTTLLFNYVITPGQSSADLDYFSVAALSANGGLIRDAASNNASLGLPVVGAAGSLGASKNIVVDTTVPTVAVGGVTSALANGTYGVGQIIPISVAFSESVFVAGNPRISLAVATPSTFAVYASGSGTSTLIFNYTVAVGNSSVDLDYSDQASLSLNGGTISDRASNSANLTLAVPGAAGSLAASKNFVIDASQPVVTGVSTASTGTFITGGVIPIVVTFDKAVTVLGGTPRLTLETGASDAVVDYSSGSGTTALTFTYTVAAGHVSPDLDYVSASALANGGATIRDSLGNNAILTLPVPGAAASLGGSSSVVIDAQRPTVASASSPLANGIYSTPTIVPVTLTLSEAVTVVVGGTPPTLKMETGVVDAIATYTGGAGVRSVLTFDYQVVAGDVSADLDYFSSAALALNGSTMKDAAGNDLDPSLPTPGAAGSLSAAKDIRIDTGIPAVLFVDASAANGAYRSGTIDIAVHFSEPVDVLLGAGALALQLETGAVDESAAYASGTGTDILHFNYAIVAGDQSADLDYVSNSALVASGGATVKDLVGNLAPLTLPAPATANSLKGRKDIVIDTTAPAVSLAASGGVRGVSANGSYGVGRTVSVKVVFTEPVIVSGTPTLTLGLSPAPVAATYQSGSGTTDLTFSLVVAAGQSDADLDYASTTALATGGGTITDPAGNTAVLTLPAPGAAGSLAANAAIVIDTTAPVVTGVDTTKADGVYGVGVVVPITVTFNKIVVVTGAPTIQLETGVSDTTVAYTSGSGSATLLFTYTIAAGHDSSGLDYIAASLLLNGGTIKDVAGNVADLSLAVPGAAGSLAANSNIIVNTSADTVAPTVVSITSPLANGTYTDGQIIPVVVTMSEPVTVTGSPFLVLNSIGSSHTTPTATYVGGSGTTTLAFTYTVLAGHSAADLDYANTGAFRLSTGGTITDVVNAANLTLPAPGGAGSLGANKDLVVNPSSATGGKPPASNVAVGGSGGGCGLGGGAALLAIALAGFARSRSRPSRG